VDQLHPQELRGRSNLATVVVGAVAGVTMARPAEAFAQEAFQFIDELGRLTSVDDVVARTGNLLARFGFEFFAFTGLEPAPDQTLEDLLLAGRFPDGFRERYTEHDYGRADPNVYRALCSSHPYRWTWSDYSEEDGPRALEVMQFFKDFHLNDGFIVPIHGPGGYEAGAAMAGEAVEMAPEAESSLYLMVLYVFERLREMAAIDALEPPKLSCREREVLAWTAQGKSAWEIGEILCLAKRTVDEHAKTAMRKLGAATRTQAVVIAIRRRLFET
jgi:LuxR family quorum sensing-dependent transcriptional regulator